jgi:hypothetical protein
MLKVYTYITPNFVNPLFVYLHTADDTIIYGNVAFSKLILHFQSDMKLWREINCLSRTVQKAPEAAQPNYSYNLFKAKFK